MTKIYDIVTNDKYEFPVKYHVVGARKVGEYIGISENYVRKCLFRNKWGGKYKAVEVGVKKPVARPRREDYERHGRKYYLAHAEKIKEGQRRRYWQKKEDALREKAEKSIEEKGAE